MYVLVFKPTHTNIDIFSHTKYLLSFISPLIKLHGMVFLGHFPKMLHSISISSKRDRTRFFLLFFLVGGGKKFSKNSMVLRIVSALILPMWSRSKQTTGTGASVDTRLAHWQRCGETVITSKFTGVVVGAEIENLKKIL